MSVQITTAFVEQYRGNVEHLVQQKGSRLRDSVSVETVVGKNAFFEQVGSTPIVLYSSGAFYRRGCLPVQMLLSYRLQ